MVKTLKVDSNLKCKEEKEFIALMKAEYDSDSKAIAQEALAMRNISFEYAKLGSYMCVILNGLAVTKVLDMIDGELNISFLKYSLTLFVCGLVCSMVMLLFFHLSQSSYMFAAHKILQDIYKIPFLEKRIFTEEERNSINKKHNRNGSILNRIGIVLAILSLICFAVGSFFVIGSI